MSGAAFDAQIQQLRQWIRQSSCTVFFGGAGVSTDSGLADFRSRKQGLYHQPNFCGYPAEEILSHRFYEEHPDIFFEFYRTRLLRLEAKPNGIHAALARMERDGLLEAVITQNADGLHQRAGSGHVVDLHGNVYRNTCQICGKAHTAHRVAEAVGIPRCECGGIIRPEITLFDEIPDMKAVMEAVRLLRRCELLIIGGTSLKVSSAHRLLENCRGRMVIINDEPTAFDGRAELVLRGRLNEIFPGIFLPQEENTKYLGGV